MRASRLSCVSSFITHNVSLVLLFGPVLLALDEGDRACAWHGVN